MFLSIVNDNENDDHEVNALKFKVEIYRDLPFSHRDARNSQFSFLKSSI